MTWKDMFLRICETLCSEDPPEGGGSYLEHLGLYIDTNPSNVVRDCAAYRFKAAAAGGTVQCSFSRPRADELLAVISDDRDVVILDPPSPCSYPLPSEENQTWRFGRVASAPHTVSLVRIPPLSRPTFDEAMEYAREVQECGGAAMRTELINRYKLK